MKKYLFIAVIALCVSLFVYFNREPKKVDLVPVLRVGVECDYPPNNWEEKFSSAFNVPVSNHEGFYADGYDVQIAKLTAGELGMTLELKKVSWNDLLPSLKNGEIDAVFSGMLDTVERRKTVAFSEPYEVKETEYAVLVNKESPYYNARTFNDFKGAKIIAPRGTNLDSVIEQIPGAIHAKPTETVQDMLNAVSGNKVDGAVVNLDTGFSYEMAGVNLRLIRFPKGEGFKLGFHGICAGLRKKDTALLNKINIALSNISVSQRRKIREDVSLRMWESLK